MKNPSIDIELAAAEFRLYVPVSESRTYVETVEDPASWSRAYGAGLLAYIRELEGYARALENALSLTTNRLDEEPLG